MFSLVYIAASATLFAIALVVILRPLAMALKLVDRPGERKHHDGHIPLIGGPVIWLVVVIGLLLSSYDIQFGALIGSTILIALGVIDDRLQVPAAIKLAFHFLAASALVTLTGISINDIGILPYLADEKYALLHTALGILTIAIAVNAFNFIDGIDGLSASMGVLALVHINLAFTIFGLNTPAELLFNIALITGALVGFLLFNLQIFNGRKIFLGDSGSMFLGFWIGYVLIMASQTPSSDTPTSVIPASLCLWVVAIPLADMITIIVRRLLSGRSPMEPDRTHLHHILLQSGLSSGRTLLVMIMSAIGAFWLGYMSLIYFGALGSILCFLIFIAVYYLAIQRIGVIVRALQ